MSTAKPKILSDNFAAKEVYEEEEIVLEVRAAGQPKPQAEWWVSFVIRLSNMLFNICFVHDDAGRRAMRRWSATSTLK